MHGRVFLDDANSGLNGVSALDNLRIPSTATRNAVETLGSILGLENTKRLRFQRLSDENALAVFFCVLRNTPEVRALDIKPTGFLSSDAANALANALANHTPKLEHLRVKLRSLERAVSDRLFAAIKNLPLRTIWIAFQSFIDEAFEGACVALRCLLCQTLQTLVVRFFDCSSCPAVFCKAIGEQSIDYTQLRTLHVQKAFLDYAAATNLCLGLKKMPHLLDLAVDIDAGGLLALREHFTSDFGAKSGVSKLCIFCPGSVRSEDFLSFFGSLSKARIGDLSVVVHESPFVCFEAFVESKLIDVGYLWRADFSALLQLSQTCSRIRKAIARNQSRHESCHRACVILIAIRRRVRKGVVVIPMEIIVAIAQMLWQTRNQLCWDEHVEVPVRKAKCSIM